MLEAKMLGNNPRFKGGATVYVATPYLYTIDGPAIDTWGKACNPKGLNRASFNQASGAFLARNFNAAWCAILNARGAGWTHFLMLHADVTPKTKYWLDALIEEQERVGADILHVVLPIKSYHGLTSTAIEHVANNTIRRLTMKEVCGFPPTFDCGTAGLVGWRLLQSTGFWIVDLRKTWIDDVWPRQYVATDKPYPCFEVRDRIFQKPDGEWLYETYPEDWSWSRKLYDAVPGIRMMATRKIVSGHIGPIEFNNSEPWGNTEHDAEMPGFGWYDAHR